MTEGDLTEIKVFPNKIFIIPRTSESLNFLESINPDNKVDFHPFDKRILKIRKGFGNTENTLTIGPTVKKTAAEMIGAWVQQEGTEAAEVEKERRWKPSCYGRFSNGMKNAKLENFSPILPLANPIGVIHQCFICSRPGHIKCNNCNSTYYCCEVHRKMDRMHKELCFAHMILNKPAPRFTSQLKREMYFAQMALLNSELVDFLTCLGVKRHFSGDLNAAHCALLEAKDKCIKMWGVNSPHMVTILTLMGKNTMLMDERERDAEKELMKAYEICQLIEPIYTQNLTYSRGMLYTTFGLLYMKYEEYTNAMFFLSEGVYYNSKASGPYSAQAADAFFPMGKLFLKTGKQIKANFTFAHCSQLWYCRLKDLFDEAIKPRMIDSRGINIEQTKEKNVKIFTNMILNNMCKNQLMYIITYAESDLKKNLAAYGHSFLGLAMYHFLGDEFEQSKDLAEVALQRGVKYGLDKELLDLAVKIKKFAIRFNIRITKFTGVFNRFIHKSEDDTWPGANKYTGKSIGNSIVMKWTKKKQRRSVSQ